MTRKRKAPPQLGLLFGADPPPSVAAQVTLLEEPVTLPRGKSRRTWQVRQLVAEARELVEAEFGDVWVEGEISNYRPAASGHLYFTLKDTEAQLPVVLFRRQALLLRFRLDDGLAVRVRGKASVYEQRGQLQLVAETLEPVGAGSLQLAFEQLRDLLKAEGLFDQERKRPLPPFPRTVAVITSPTGAVIQDFLNVVGRRHSGMNVLIAPVTVQGDAAASEIEAAIGLVNAIEAADLIVLARGGGSLEDLAAFNSERVARAIVASRVPVVSAIGHESDFTIADFAADLRAPTPSAAAELVTEAQHRIGEYLAELGQQLDRAARFQIMQSRQRWTRLPVARAEQRIMAGLHRMVQRVDEARFNLEAAIKNSLRQNRHTVVELRAAVLHHDPRQRLGSARTSLAGWTARLEHALDRSLATVSFRVDSAEGRIHRAAKMNLFERRAGLSSIRGRLKSLSPLDVLQRGYALVQDERGAVIRSVGELSAGQRVHTRLGDGSFESEVKSRHVVTKGMETTG